mgnify:CR=1 FL=1
MLKTLARNVYYRLPPPVARVYAAARSLLTEAAHFKKMEDAVREATQDIAEHSKLFAGEKLLIDCGFNNGVVLQKMLKRLPDFEAYGFEVNAPLFSEQARKLAAQCPRILSLNFAAVSDRDGMAQFVEMGTRAGRFPAQGTTIVPNIRVHPISLEAQDVPCVDLSSWLKEVWEKHNGPYIAMKMDIEGAEYDVLEHMIEDGTLELVHDLVVEFHSRRYTGLEKQAIERRELAIRDALSQSRTHVLEWV